MVVCRGGILVPRHDEPIIPALAEARARSRSTMAPHR